MDACQAKDGLCSGSNDGMWGASLRASHTIRWLGFRIYSPAETQRRRGKPGNAYWDSARTLVTQSGMSNRWLEEQGLLSVRELWIAVHYPDEARRADQ